LIFEKLVFGKIYKLGTWAYGLMLLGWALRAIGMWALGMFVKLQNWVIMLLGLWAYALGLGSWGPWDVVPWALGQ
jgi:hypothetical protein